MRYFLLIFVFVSFYELDAQNTQSESKNDWIFSGSAQLRTELDGRDFDNLSYPSLSSSSRIRLGIEKTLFDKVTFFVQFQDSRMFGQEKNTLKSLSNVDIHQAYVTVNNLFDIPISVQAGRVELSYGTNRFIGSNSWHYISRSFDGAAIKYKDKDFWIDVFNYTVCLSKEYQGGAEPSNYPYPVNPDTSYTFTGFWSNLRLFDNSFLDVFSYYEWDRKKDEFEKRRLDTTFSGKRTIELNRLTAGFNYNLKFDYLSFLAEFGYQFGSLTEANKSSKKDTTITFKEKDISAYTFAFKAQYDIKPFSISLNTEFHSGTKGGDTATSLTEVNLYDNTYSTKHALYGYMDYFNTMDKATLNLGLNDFYLRFVYNPKESPFYAQLDGHYFMTNQKNKDGKSTLGTEIDLVLRYTVVKGVAFEWGGSIFLPSDIMKEVYKVKKGNNYIYREDPSFWTYLMLRAFL